MVVFSLLRLVVFFFLRAQGVSKYTFHEGLLLFPVLNFSRSWNKTSTGEMPIFSLYCFFQPQTYNSGDACAVLNVFPKRLLPSLDHV